MESIKIIIADSHYLSRKGLSTVLSATPKFEIIAETGNVSELLTLPESCKPNVVIIDYTSTHFNIDNIEQIIHKFPASKLLAITGLHGNFSITKSLNAGVTSHLLKECEEDEIVEAIEKTAIGERFMCGTITESLTEKDPEIEAKDGTNISVREVEIITLIAEGFSNKEIASKLFLSTHTITTHRKNIMSKLGLNNTAGLVLFAVRENLVRPNHFLFSS